MAKSLYDEFKIIKKSDLNGESIKSLTYLYMPILGIDSFAMYTTLSTFDINVNYNYKKVLDLLSLKGITNINNAINKLQGIGLIKEFSKENSETILYQLNKPLTFEEFLKEESLRVLLESEIGQDEVLKLIEKEVSSISPVGYKDSTKKFDAVFEISTENDESIFKNIFVEKIDDIAMDNTKFNYTLFEMLLENSFPAPEVLKEGKFKEYIKRLSFVYKLDEQKMVDCVLKSFDIDHDLSYATLSKNAKTAFSKEYQVTTPKLVAVEHDEFMDSAKDDETVALCARLEAISFADTLETLSGMKPAESELGMFEQLYGVSNLSAGAINVMIMMANSDKDGVLPGLQYFEKIANTWARAGVKNAYDAMKFTLREKEKRKESLNKNGKKTVHIPDWYKEYREEADKQLNNHTDSVSQDLLDAAKKLFEDDL